MFAGSSSGNSYELPFQTLWQHFLSILKIGRPPVWWFVAVFVLIDLAFIGVHVVWMLFRFFLDASHVPRLWDLGVDGAFPEMYNYIKWMFIICALLFAYVRTKSPMLLCFSIVFLIVLIDDWGQLHEQGGDMIAPYLGFERIVGLKASAIGELFTFALLGIGVVALLACANTLCSEKYKPLNSYFLIVLAGLIFTAVVVDTIHSLSFFKAENVFAKFANGALGVFEDGGEMIFGSIGCGGAIAAKMLSRKE